MCVCVCVCVVASMHTCPDTHRENRRHKPGCKLGDADLSIRRHDKIEANVVDFFVLFLGLFLICLESTNKGGMGQSIFARLDDW